MMLVRSLLRQHQVRTEEATNVTLTPATGVLQVVNNSKTVPKGYKNTLKITRKVGTNKVIISGNSPLGTSGIKEWISVTDPTAYALDIFKKSLAEKGITFAAGSKSSASEDARKCKSSCFRKSMNLKDLMIPFMKLSNNTHAEVLAKEMGKVVHDEGSWKAGLLVMQEYALSIGLDVSKWTF